MKRTALQNRQIHALLTQRGLMRHKEALVYNYTNGRTCRSSEMRYCEAENFIHYLKGAGANAPRSAGLVASGGMLGFPAKPTKPAIAGRQRLIRTIIGLCYGVDKVRPLLYLIDNRGKPNYDAINQHIKRHLHQSGLNALDTEQLKKMIIYFKILKKNYGKD